MLVRTPTSASRYGCCMRGRDRLGPSEALAREVAISRSGLAQRIGYESEPAFNRAFKKATGSPPTVWRKAAAHVSREH